MSEAYDFTSDWFSHLKPIWTELLSQFATRKILEVGSYEGRSTCFLIETCAAVAPLEIQCIDTWQGGVDNDRSIMGDVERRFDANVQRAIERASNSVTFRKHKAYSHDALSRLLVEGQAGAFDLVYIDGSHQAPDVLADAVLGFKLAKVGGLLIFDDYLWNMEGHGRQDAYNMPKPAIDAFVNIYQRKLSIIRAPLLQLYTKKTSD